MVDISRILYTFSDADVRKEVEETLVEDYYMHLKEAMEKAGRSPDFTVEQVSNAAGRPLSSGRLHVTVTLGWGANRHRFPLDASSFFRPCILYAMEHDSYLIHRLL